MKSRIVSKVIFGIIFAVAVIAISGCIVGKSKTDNTQNGDNGKIMVPDTEWEKDGDNEKKSDDTQGTNDGNFATKPPEEQGGLKQRTEPTIDMKLFVDGQEHPMDQPVFLVKDQEVKFEFHFASTGSELAYYRIEIPAPYPPPAVGELKGFSAIIPYEFTFNPKDWSKDMMNVMLSVQDGSASIRQIIVMDQDRPVKVPPPGSAGS